MKMEKLELERLKKALNNLKLKNNQFYKAKGKEKESIEIDINYLTKSIISKFNLMQYNLYINEESYDVNFFIHNVENIISNEEEKDSNN